MNLNEFDTITKDILNNISLDEESLNEDLDALEKTRDTQSDNLEDIKNQISELRAKARAASDSGDSASEQAYRQRINTLQASKRNASRQVEKTRTAIKVSKENQENKEELENSAEDKQENTSESLVFNSESHKYSDNASDKAETPLSFVNAKMTEENKAELIKEGFALNRAAKKYDKVTDKKRELQDKLNLLKKQLNDLDPANKKYDSLVDKLQNKIRKIENKLQSTKEKVNKAANKLNKLDESADIDLIYKELCEACDEINEAMNIWNNREIEKDTTKKYINDRLFSGSKGQQVRSLVEGHESLGIPEVDFYVGIIREEMGRDVPNMVRLYDYVSKVSRYLK